MIAKLAKSFVVLSALAAMGLFSTSALADKVKDSGSYEATVTKKEVLVIPDQEGHVLTLAESSGSVSSGGPLDGFSAVTLEIADLRQGNGPHQGYVVFSKGADQRVVRFDGTVTTIMKDGKPNTTMKGNYAIVSGAGSLADAEGEGTYSGYFTAEDAYHLDWQGMVSGPKEAVAEQ